MTIGPYAVLLRACAVASRICFLFPNSGGPDSLTSPKNAARAEAEMYGSFLLKASSF